MQIYLKIKLKKTCVLFLFVSDRGNVGSIGLSFFETGQWSFAPCRAYDFAVLTGAANMIDCLVALTRAANMIGRFCCIYGPMVLLQELLQQNHWSVLLWNGWFKEEIFIFFIASDYYYVKALHKQLFTSFATLCLSLSRVRNTFIKSSEV
jgi:hypothetical protein